MEAYWRTEVYPYAVLLLLLLKVFIAQNFSNIHLDAVLDVGIGPTFVVSFTTSPLYTRDK
jgi:uncharacterized integral membrane protein